MRQVWLTLLSAFSLAMALASEAAAKPPEEDVIDRAERAEERANRAAERASEAAERAAERDHRERDSGRDRDVRDRDAERNPTATEGPDRVGTGDDQEVELASASGSGREDYESEGSSGGSSAGAPEVNENDADTGSISGSGNGDDAEDDSSGQGSGAEDGDHDGTDDDGGDDGEDGDDDDQKGHDGRGVIVPVESDDAGHPYREGELVIMSDDAGLLARAEALGFGIIEVRDLTSIGSLVARLRRPEGVSSREALDLLRSREPDSPSGYNYIYQAAGDTPEAPDEQQVTVIPKSKGGPRIGVIDGFSAEAVGDWKVERLVDKPALVGHGETVTGILLRDLSEVYQVRPQQMLLLDVMREHGRTGAADVSALVVAFDHLVTAKVDVANLSLAGPDHPALRRAVSQSVKQGTVIVAAVGNAGPAAPPAFPAAYDGVVGVAAVDSSGRPYLYSGRGPHVDIAALGIEASPDGLAGELAGTSYAAPHVTAMLAGARNHNQSASVDALLAAFATDVGEPGRDQVYGLGILTLSPQVDVALARAGN